MPAPMMAKRFVIEFDLDGTPLRVDRLRFNDNPVETAAVAGVRQYMASGILEIRLHVKGRRT